MEDDGAWGDSKVPLRSLEIEQVVDLIPSSYLNKFIIEGDKMFSCPVGKVISEKSRGIAQVHEKHNSYNASQISLGNL
jgi:hypothetical protein